MAISFELLPSAMEDVLEQLQTIEDLLRKNQSSVPAETKVPESNPLDGFIPKTEIRGKLASSSTLWHWEKAGKLQAYGIGGKRYYKRTDIENLFKEIK